MTAPATTVDQGRSRPGPSDGEPTNGHVVEPGTDQQRVRDADDIDARIAAAQAWFDQPRFAGIVRLHTARDVARQQGSIVADHSIARDAAEGFHARLLELFAAGRQITTFGPYSPGQAVVQKRAGLDGIYLGGWATSAKGSQHEDPGPDLASYPLSAVPDEAAAIVRALLTADRNQQFERSRMSEADRRATPAIDFRPFIIADADTGHGGDAHVRNLIRRFVEVGVPGYHIEDQRPGAKKCGHQDGKVLVAQAEQNKRLNAARLQLDIMRVPGIIVARTDAEAATLLDDISDERDQPFVLGATNTDVPSFRLGFVAILHRLAALGLEDVRGHLLYAIPDADLARATAWLDAIGLLDEIAERVRSHAEDDTHTDLDGVLDAIDGRFVEVWQHAAGVMTIGEAVTSAIEAATTAGRPIAMSPDEWRSLAVRASFSDARATAAALGIELTWDPELPRTPDGYYRVRGGIDYAIAKSLAAAPFADLLWMETKTADLDDARRFAEAIHAVYPDKMLAYNLSPSFNWDTTGMTDDEMRRFPEELGALGYVFDFITYGGHQIDGLGAEEFATSLRRDGMLALARLQRRLRLIESPYKGPQALVGGDRLDAALTAATGRTASTKAMGKASTHHQHLVPVEAAPAMLAGWLRAADATSADPVGAVVVRLVPDAAGSDHVELQVTAAGGESLLTIAQTTIVDTAGRRILAIARTTRAERTPASWAGLALTYLLQRTHADLLHVVSPSPEDIATAGDLAARGVFTGVEHLGSAVLIATVDRTGLAAAVAAAVGVQRSERRPKA